MILDIVQYGEAVLRKKCTTITEVDSTLEKLVNDMLETMVDADGIGLAAPQIGKDIRLALELSGPKESESEGCLSIQEVRAKVKRPTIVKATLPQLDGSVKIIETDGLLARAIQHEVDHLLGVLFTDRLSTTKKTRLKKKLKELSVTKWERRPAE